MGAYRSLAGSEAGDVGRLFSENLNQAVGNLQNLGVFGTQAGLGATANAAQGYGQLSEQSRNRTMGGLGTVGKMAGLGMGV